MEKFLKPVKGFFNQKFGFVMQVAPGDLQIIMNFGY
jgi:hypothetical protein